MGLECYIPTLPLGLTVKRMPFTNRRGEHATGLETKIKTHKVMTAQPNTCTNGDDVRHTQLQHIRYLRTPNLEMALPAAGLYQPNNHFRCLTNKSKANGLVN